MTVTIGVVTYYQVGRSSVVENADPAVGWDPTLSQTAAINSPFRVKRPYYKTSQEEWALRMVYQLTAHHVWLVY